MYLNWHIHQESYEQEQVDGLVPLVFPSIKLINLIKPTVRNYYI